MNPIPGISFDSPTLLCAAAVALLAGGVVTLRRRPDWSTGMCIFFALAGASLSLAAGGLIWQRPVDPKVVVMVDLSPSTRGAVYRNPSDRAALIRFLLGDARHELLFFSESIATSDAPPGDLPARRTNFRPPPADLIVLLSDANFDLPEHVPPTFIYPDPALDRPLDSAIQDLAVDGSEARAVVRSIGSSASIGWAGSVEDARPELAEPGQTILRRGVVPGSPVTVKVRVADLIWPENDSMTILPAPPTLLQRWWVGSSAPDQSWRAIPAADLPQSAAAWLDARVVVLNNVPADAISSDARRRLSQYARDLGGAILIVGGDRSFAAGAYAGTELEALSPLASEPPDERRHWMILVDASGSMSASAGAGSTRWQRCADAVSAAVARLPDEDMVSIGTFSSNLTWAIQSRRAIDVRTLWPPRDLVPRGPTNLEPALLVTLKQMADVGAKDLLIVTDARATIGDAPALASAISGARASVALLALLADGAETVLGRLVTNASGSVISESNPERWAEQARAIVAARAAGDASLLAPAEVRFSDDSAAPRRASLNRTWLKPGATLLARTDNAPAAATWGAGTGTVAAAAWTAEPDVVAALAARVQRPPRDPRFTITWTMGSRIHIVVDASNESGYLNDLDLVAEFRDTDSTQATTHPLILESPGRYGLSIDAPGDATLASVRFGQVTIDRRALAGRYAQEFDRIGNNDESMQQLASTTGGQVLRGDAFRRIDLPRQTRPLPLAPWLALAGGVCASVGLILWRLR